MNRYRRLLRRRIILSFLQGLVILLILLLLLVGKLPLVAGRAISYNRAAGYVLVQLVELPEPAEAERHAEAEWTLYGDGRLLFPAPSGDAFWQAHLSATAIWQLLDVLINQDHVLSISSPCTVTSSTDDPMCLTVAANGQQKDILLQSIPPAKGSPALAGLETFLLAYHPMQATVSAANPDRDGDVDTEGGNG